MGKVIELKKGDKIFSRLERKSISMLLLMVVIAFSAVLFFTNKEMFNYKSKTIELKKDITRLEKESIEMTDCIVKLEQGEEC